VQYNLSTEDYIHGGLQKDFYGQDDVEACKCPLCDDFVPSTVVYRERGNLAVVRCDRCDLFYVNPRAKASSENYHGDPAVYFEEARLIFAGKKAHHRDKNYKWGDPRDPEAQAEGAPARHRHEHGLFSAEVRRGRVRGRGRRAFTVALEDRA
jgi:hypothetical protein